MQIRNDSLADEAALRTVPRVFDRSHPGAAVLIVKRMNTPGLRRNLRKQS